MKAIHKGRGSKNTVFSVHFLRGSLKALRVVAARELKANPTNDRLRAALRDLDDAQISGWMKP
jgi:hypothetical protein